jgi:hypothetical protein
VVFADRGLARSDSVNAQETIMEKSNKPSEDMNARVAQTMEQARGAMENYLDFFQKTMSASPWAGTELNKKVADYAQQNVDTAFGFAQKLTQAKDLHPHSPDGALISAMLTPIQI